MILDKESVIKTLPKIASKFLFTSSRYELSYQLLPLITLRSSIKSQSIVETIFLTFYGRKNMDKIDFIKLIPSETQKNNGIMEFSCLEIHYKNDEVKPVPISFA